MFGYIEEELKFNVLLGFDGFIDKILKPIKTKSKERVIPFQMMKEFSGYLADKSGKSCSIDLEIIEEKVGGNMPIVANALGNLGCETVCVGAMGYPEIEPIFQKMSSNCKLVSVSNPGYCSSLEFEDGKLMMATNTFIDQLDYNMIISRISEAEIINYFNKCDALAFLNWGELIHSNDIWENILVRILPECTFKKKKTMLVDFSDFSKRESAEVLKMLELLDCYNKLFDITVSLNENELDLFFDKLSFGKQENTIQEKAITLSNKFHCKNFVVHLLESTLYVKKGVVHTVAKEVIENPKLITGGGDNFNAGLLFGLLLGFDIKEAIQVGSGLSCLYVRDAKEISLQELSDYKFV